MRRISPGSSLQFLSCISRIRGQEDEGLERKKEWCTDIVPDEKTGICASQIAGCGNSRLPSTQVQDVSNKQAPVIHFKGTGK